MSSIDLPRTAVRSSSWDEAIYETDWHNYRVIAGSCDPCRGFRWNCPAHIERYIGVRKIRPFAREIIVFASGIVVGLAAALYWTTAQPPSPLTKNLPSGWNDASSQFDARIRRRFPIGTSAQKLIDELAAEGFKPTWFEAAGEYGAKREEGSFVCNIAARVFWRLDQNGAVLAIRGTYHEEGCL
ncbi:hypothetical protein F9288_19515 [Sphingomonas sp. CL5.1]|uniref:hypothetical protein n=1 Tax=Sphingomonas sp. CL5.1 TaxID=2653203 RepID=UPI00158189FA|nr:hypothetical protein [Sphingomonas sp. CL5.1]QKS01562.1 hypothetical protein F9288_19515 [Sphingomonas sp. CL5.1]